MIITITITLLAVLLLTLVVTYYALNSGSPEVDGAELRRMENKMFKKIRDAEDEYNLCIRYIYD